MLALHHNSLINGQENDIDDLQSQLHRYRQIMKHLESENQTLQQENENYKSVNEQLLDKSQQNERLYKNELARLRTEIYKLREHEALNNSYNHFQQETSLFSTKSLVFSDVYDEIEKRRYSLTIRDPEGFDEFELETDTDTESEMKIDPVIAEYEDADDVVTQFLQLGFEKQKILKARDNVENKGDPNAILEQLENDQHEEDANYAYNPTMRLDLHEKQEKIDSLLTENKLKIDKLPTRNNELRMKNQGLTQKQKSSWFSNLGPWW